MKHPYFNQIIIVMIAAVVGMILALGNPSKFQVKVKGDKRPHELQITDTHIKVPGIEGETARWLRIVDQNGNRYCLEDCSMLVKILHRKSSPDGDFWQGRFDYWPKHSRKPMRFIVQPLKIASWRHASEYYKTQKTERNALLRWIA